MSRNVSEYVFVYCVCEREGSRNTYLITYILGPIFSVDWHQILMRLVNLYFLSHTHRLFYKPSLLPRKCLSWIKNETVEEVWTRHTELCPVPRDVKAPGLSGKQGFRASPCTSSGVFTPTLKTWRTFLKTEDRPPGKTNDFLSGTALHVLSDSELGKVPIVPFLPRSMTNLPSPSEKAERNDSQRRHANHIKIAGAFWFSWILRREPWAQKRRCGFWHTACSDGLSAPTAAHEQSGTGTENLPEVLAATPARALVMYEGSRPREGGPPSEGGWGWEAGIGSSGPPFMLVQSPYPFPLNHSFSERLHWNTIFVQSTFFFSFSISISCPLTLKKQRWELFNHRQPCGAWAVSDLHRPSANILSGAKIPQLFREDHPARLEPHLTIWYCSLPEPITQLFLDKR